MPPLRAELRLRRGALVLDAALDVADGECVALVGPSGAGKSTFLAAVAGLVEPDGGRVRLGEEVWFDEGRGGGVPTERRGIGYVFQDYALFATMSVRANVAYGIESGTRRERHERALGLIERFGLAARAEARPSELSGGERQRVALARALASDPRLMLLDEPLSALDARTRAEASRVLAGVLGESRVPALIVTHDFAEAAALADRIAVLDAGRIVQVGAAAELAGAPASAFVADLSGAVVLAGTARPGAGGLTEVTLEGGGRLASTDRLTGPVVATVFPWEIAVAPAGTAVQGSSLNHLDGHVSTLSGFGNRARVEVRCPEPVVAEVTSESVARLGLEIGTAVTASWKATATRLAPR